ncbi:hypothetical protein IIA15_07100 [candidate division TA06 bacterium]|nr:hypothetical protein [candidate division TA06 bacterium]
MAVVNQIFDAFYTRLVLRDIFGKVFPGLVVLLAFGEWFKPTDELLEWLHDLSLIQAAALVAASWIAGFVVQSLGELRGEGIGRLIHYMPRLEHEQNRQRNNAESEKGKTEGGWDDTIQVARTLRTLFREHTSGARDADQRMQYERFVVIKEACGNSYVAVMTYAAIKLLFFWFNIFAEKDCSADSVARWKSGMPDLLSLSPIIVLAVVAITALRVMHIKHVHRQYEHVVSVLQTKNVPYPPHTEGVPPANPLWFWVGIPVFYLVVVLLGSFLGWLSRISSAA